MGREVEGRFKRRGGTCVCVWLIHVDIWQKPSKYSNYPTIKNKLKKINFQKKPFKLLPGRDITFY